MNLFANLFRARAGGIDAAEAQSRLRQQPAPFLLDVRQPEEYKSGHIEGARLIPLGELGRRLGELPTDREILCVCRSGSRSSQAAQQLVARGYKATNLSGGMLAWVRAGLEVKRE